MNAACAGFSYALATATGFVEAGIADTVLLIGAEVFSRILDFTDRQTCDPVRRRRRRRDRAGRRPPGIEGTVLGADGSAAEILILPGGGSREARHARDRRREPATGPHAERPRGVQARGDRDGGGVPRGPGEERTHADDVDLLIPHQANARIMSAVAERLHIPPEQGGDRRGRGRQHVAASIPIALDRAYRAGRMHEGDLVAVHLVRRRAHVGRHGDALDAAPASRGAV